MDEEEREYANRESQWDEQWPSTEATSSAHPPQEPDDLDEVAPFPEVSGTSDLAESVRDAEPYVPATEPPVIAGGPEGIEMGTGFGLSPEEENDEDERPQNDGDIEDMAIRTLQDDSLTSGYPLEIHVRDRVIYLRGTVQSIEDADYAVNLLGTVPRVVDVVDETAIEPSS